jgi:hypothetical protein
VAGGAAGAKEPDTRDLRRIPSRARHRGCRDRDALPRRRAREGVFAVGLLYLCAGMFGSRSRFDVMSVFWWSALALGCSAGVAWYEGIIP